MKLAVIETGGKQYLVSGGQKIQIEKLETGSGKWNFDKVLLVADEKGVEIGRPYLAGKKVSAEILGEKRLPKVTTFKYHSKTRYRKKKGHRQTVALVKIVGI
ncbi:50S ribosomal protein L21 [Candidatus Giovannonibacteria bacterium RIFCSPLOWO2_12_FULL_44_25]|uniref:Large ribosomal subunit protein bL21 n=3 Tax=Parcubacteria group TaxID=1794811 RepID=A0A837IJ65_9BACT|nr:MAG: 50S ribosomal protein L21 [Parcubacteria group bacterium GW2011_GWC1_44_10]KKT60044.1 MAG: 50S ribosomal protein L21 [Candidatus Giovannonibacteria bacterium GW2011_GWA1_44_25]KKU12894.1 MAG: 50S ribosomal protein L21 [Candidatus Azambacteria bacterium GW2011_GWC2_45_7b]KKU30162.1 MAG: 50S ribosomal protein L21 [Candidatus Giovannonibacteria bacterium GW2011_GWB1_46_20]OGF49746.1 MAG: 50S ribosomal protein L21 [Candidatus Giovannonibacteria bacterium GWA2_45_15]OGF59455.1 MAG: 50S ribo